MRHETSGEFTPATRFQQYVEGCLAEGNNGTVPEQGRRTGIVDEWPFGQLELANRLTVETSKPGGQPDGAHKIYIVSFGMQVPGEENTSEVLTLVWQGGQFLANHGAEGLKPVRDSEGPAGDDLATDVLERIELLEANSSIQWEPFEPSDL